MTLVYFIIALSILIIIHEFGHYLVARLSGIRVEKFSVGFGPKLIGIKKGDTEYRISALPFGGYVKMSGDDPATVDKSDEKAFYNKSVYKRAGVVVAGPVMNLILCIILLPIVFMIGKTQPVFLNETPVVADVRYASPAERGGFQKGDTILKVGEKPVTNWKEVIDDVLVSTGQDLQFTLMRGGEEVKVTAHIENLPDGRGGFLGVEPPLFIGNEAVLDNIKAGSPASAAGLMPGDRVIAINGNEIKDWTDMLMAVGKSEGKPQEFTLLRNGTEVKATLTPEFDKGLDRYLIGVMMDMTKRNIPMETVRYGFFESIKAGIEEAGRLADLTFTVLGKLVTLKLSYKTLGGPIQIAQATAAAAKSGFASFIFFLAFLSMQLGILNLMPVPVLDGGHLVFFGIEAIRRKPLSERIQGIAQNVGLALIILLLVVVSINDIMNIEAVRNIIDKLF